MQSLQPAAAPILGALRPAHAHAVYHDLLNSLRLAPHSLQRHPQLQLHLLLLQAHLLLQLLLAAAPHAPGHQGRMLPGSAAPSLATPRLATARPDVSFAVPKSCCSDWDCHSAAAAPSAGGCVLLCGPCPAAREPLSPSKASHNTIAYRTC